MTMIQQELLKCENIKKVYHTKLGMQSYTALNDINFSLCAGEFVAVMGPSGSGKTTLLNILASLDQPTSGNVLLEGQNFKDIPEKNIAQFRRDNLGFVFQDFNLLDTFSLKDNILLPLVLSQTPIKEMEQRLKPIAAMLHIEDLLEKYPYEVSGGEKQRAAVARAVITEPKIFLADEPTGALDSKSSTNLLQIFRALNDAGKTILMVTHSSMAASYAKRVLFIKDGSIYSQIYRGEEDNHAFFERIVNNITVLSNGGVDIG